MYILGLRKNSQNVLEKNSDYRRSVCNIFSRPYLVSPRLTSYKLDENKYKILPYDVFFKHTAWTNGFKELDLSMSNEERDLAQINAFKNVF